MKQCKECQYWEKDNKTHGICSRAVDSAGYMYERPFKDLERKPMYTADGSAYISTLYVRFDHCCKEFKERDKNED